VFVGWVELGGWWICVDDLIALRLGEVYYVLVYWAFICR